MISADKLPPHAPEMERAVIGCILQKPAYADDCIARFKAGEEVFYDLKNREAYAGLIEMRKTGVPIDFITASLKIKDIEFLHQCETAAISTENFEHYADEISEAFMLRKTIAACTEAAASVYDKKESAAQIISGIESRLQIIREIRGSDEIVSPSKAAILLAEHLEFRFQLQGKRSGIETGFHYLDAVTDGLQYGELSVIGARPSQGKTALATSIVHHACLKNKIPTLFVTLEMSVAALCRRLISQHCQFPMADLKSGSFDEKDFGRFSSFNVLLANSPIFFLDNIGGNDINRIANSIKRTVKSYGVRLVVIDYLQKISASGQHEKRTYEVGEVSTQLKAVATKCGCSVLALAQLSREPDKQKGRPPQISDLADSAQIERDADFIGLLQRDRTVDDGKDANLFIAKQRDGELGTCHLNFVGKYASFTNPVMKTETED